MDASSPFDASRADGGGAVILSAGDLIRRVFRIDLFTRGSQHR
jgi:hypothetical protein